LWLTSSGGRAAHEAYTLPLPDALPILPDPGERLEPGPEERRVRHGLAQPGERGVGGEPAHHGGPDGRVRGGVGGGRLHPPVPGRSESTRLNSSHVKISYTVFCL